MPQFLEFEISDFQGIATSKRHPQKNECQECKNFDTRYIDGDLTLRAGFLQKYPVIADADHRSKLSNITPLEVENFYVPDGNGQEITVWVCKATLAGETPISEGTPIDRGILALLSSHQFVLGDSQTTADIFASTTIGLSTKTWVVNKYVGLTVRIVAGLGLGQSKTIISNTATTLTVSTWTTTPDGTSVFVIDDRWMQRNWDGVTTGKYWLNHTIISKIGLKVSDGQYQLDTLGSDLVSDKLNNWSIINITKSPYEVAQIIDTYDVGTPAGQVGIYITNYNNEWSVEDEVVLMKNYIPYDSLLEMYNCASEDVTFHKVLNDLRIGFGGYEDRIGLSVGYRYKRNLIGTIGFGSFTETQIEELATVNNLILDVYNGIGQDATFSLQVAAGGTLPIGTYSFQMIGYLDGFNAVLLAKESIELTTATNNLIVTPLIRLGSNNKRLTRIEVFYSNANDVYYKFRDYYLSNDLTEGNSWELDTEGYLRPRLASSSDLYLTSDALSTTSESDTVATWIAVGGCDISSEATTPAPYNGTRSMLIESLSAIRVYVGASYNTAFIKGAKYLFDFYVYANNPCTVKLNGTVTDLGSVPSWDIATTGAWVRIQAYVTINPSSTSTGKITIISELSTSDYLAVDNFHIYLYTMLANFTVDILGTGSEISENLGYQPTFDMVKSWDQAVVTSGRTFFVNPYIDKRWENKIFRSHISGAGAFMYDAASAESYIDIEAFDNNDLVGIAILPNLQFLALNRNGAQRVDPDTGAARQVDKGKGCVARKSIVNFGDKVCWCGEHDIFMSDGLNVVSITDKTIREDYRELTTKSSIIATMEEKDNAYRFFSGDTTTRTEFILTKKGWLKRVNGSDYPIAYTTSVDGTVNFMISTGKIYLEDGGESTVLDDNIGLSTPIWQSVDIDAELIGESISERDFIYIASMWIDYTLNYAVIDPPSLNFSIYLDGTLAKTKTFVMEPNTRYKQFVKLPLGSNCRRFSLYVSVTGTDGVGAPTPPASYVYGKHLSIHSTGVMFKTVKAGLHN